MSRTIQLGSLWSCDMDWLPANCCSLPVPHHNVLCRSYYLSCLEDLQGYDKKNFFHCQDLYRSDRTVLWVSILQYTNSHWQRFFYWILCILCNWLHHLNLCSKGEETLEMWNYLLGAVFDHHHGLLLTDPSKDSWHSIKIAFWAKLRDHILTLQTYRHDRVNYLQSCFLWWIFMHLLVSTHLYTHLPTHTHTHTHTHIKYYAYNVYMSALALWICLLLVFLFIF